MIASHKIPNGVIIAGTQTSIGKSSVSVGFMRALKKRGLLVSPFKVGPDYIDPGHHSRACARPSYNLDSWMCSKKYVRALYDEVSAQGNISVVEGVMGLFDGAYSNRDTGSTAEMAKLLNLPVILIVDGSGMARSFAAIVKGFEEMDTQVKILGVIANRVRSPGHAQILKEALKKYTSCKFLGNLPHRPELEIPSRHLGLHMGHEQMDTLYDKWADHIENHLDVAWILKQFGVKGGKKVSSAQKELPARWKVSKPSPFKIAIARDEAFQFLYQDTLDLIRYLGGTIEFFSPVKSLKLPVQINAIYFPGGYPEQYAGRLSKNKKLISEISDFALQGGPILAECGGLMYLGKELIDENGKSHPMVGLFDYSTSIANKSLTLGYRSLRGSLKSNNSAGLLKGHEFHYSSFLKNPHKPQWTHFQKNKGKDTRDGYVFKNCHAWYSHIYWGTVPKLFKSLLGLKINESC